MRAHRTFRTLVAAALVIPTLTACGDEPFGITEQFLLRLPVDGLNNPTPLQLLSGSAADTVEFQWEEPLGAETYELVMWPAESDEELISTDRATLDPADAALGLPLHGLKRIEVAFSNRFTGQPDTLFTIEVLQSLVLHADLGDALTAAGMPAGGAPYLVWWSIVAETPSGRRFRSPDVHMLEIFHN